MTEISQVIGTLSVITVKSDFYKIPNPYRAAQFNEMDDTIDQVQVTESKSRTVKMRAYT
jgi:hypothetical protein